MYSTNLRVNYRHFKSLNDNMEQDLRKNLRQSGENGEDGRLMSILVRFILIFFLVDCFYYYLEV